MKPVSTLERYALAFAFPIYVIILLNLGSWYSTLDLLAQFFVNLSTIVILIGLRIWDWDIIKRDIHTRAEDK